MWSIWRITGVDPYCIWNELDVLYRPLYELSDERYLPPYPTRLEAVKTAFGLFSYEFDVKLAGGKTSQRQAG